MTTKQAIEQVMTGKRKPMTVAQIAETAIPLSNLHGATPKQVIYSVLYFGEQARGRTRHPHRRGDLQAQPEAAEGVTDLAGLAVESYAHDVRAVAEKLGQGRPTCRRSPRRYASR